MADAVAIDRLHLLSKSSIAREWGIDRRTVDRLVDGITPAGKERQNPVWRIKDIAGTLDRYCNGGYAPSGEDFDPAQLPPKDRKDWYESENKRIAVEKEKGRLIPDDEFEKALADTFKKLKTVLVTLPDVLERDANMTPQQVIKSQNVIDETCAQLYRELVGDAD